MFFTDPIICNLHSKYRITNASPFIPTVKFTQQLTFSTSKVCMYNRSLRKNVENIADIRVSDFITTKTI
jgi:hypothetical protein